MLGGVLYDLRSFTHCEAFSAVQNRLKTLHGGTIASMVDLGGSLAVASMGLHATGVSTDLNGKTYEPPSYLTPSPFDCGNTPMSPLFFTGLGG